MDGLVTTDPTSDSMKTGSVGLMCASKALLVSFEDYGVCNMRERIAAKKKKVADETTKKSLSAKEKDSRATKKATTDDQGRKLTKT